MAFLLHQEKRNETSDEHPIPRTLGFRVDRKHPDRIHGQSPGKFRDLPSFWVEFIASRQSYNRRFLHAGFVWPELLRKENFQQNIEFDIPSKLNINQQIDVVLDKIVISRVRKTLARFSEYHLRESRAFLCPYIGHATIAMAMERT